MRGGGWGRWDRRVWGIPAAVNAGPDASPSRLLQPSGAERPVIMCPNLTDQDIVCGLSASSVHNSHRLSNVFGRHGYAALTDMRSCVFGPGSNMLTSDNTRNHGIATNGKQEKEMQSQVYPTSVVYTLATLVVFNQCSLTTAAVMFVATGKSRYCPSDFLPPPRIV